MAPTTHKSSCPLCDRAAPEPFLTVLGVPVLQNAPAMTAEAARGVPRGDLAITACPGCGFVYNAAFDAALMHYSTSYENTQCHSPLFQDYLRHLARYLIEKYELRGKSVVEVGCGKGHFLRLICELGNNRGLGFDPAYDGPAETDGGRVRFVRDLYDDRHTGYPADLICCRHVLEHVPDPMVMLEAVRRAAGERHGVAIFFEVPTVDWILADVAFWDFFYEHCSYFTRRTLPWAFARAGFEVDEVREAFGEQYLWLEAHPSPQPLSPAPEGVDELVQRVAAFSREVSQLIEAWHARLAQYDGDGGCAVWGAGAKGVTLLNQLDPRAERVAFVIDVNPAKQDRFLPGTGHLIAAPRILRTRPVSHIVAMNSNYREEIEAEARSQCGAAVVVDWL